MKMLDVLKERAPIFMALAWRSPESPTAPGSRDADATSNRQVCCMLIERTRGLRCH